MPNSFNNYCYQAIAVTDLTSLNHIDTEQDIIKLCNKAITPHGKVAAVCVFPQFIKIAKSALQNLSATDIKIATVCNFPVGNSKTASVLHEVELAIESGADEIDLVIPYQQIIAENNTKTSHTLVKSVKNLCGDFIKVKTIIESGMLKTQDLIEKASLLALDAGTDFIKTSTGKVAINATLEAAKCMLNSIKKYNYDAGFKASGGIKTALEAKKYLQLAEGIMSSSWVTTSTFRFGASSLLGELLASLKVEVYPNNR